MLSIQASFAVFLFAACLVGIVTGWKTTWTRGVGVAMAIALLSASWFEMTIADLPISVATATAVVVLSVMSICNPKVLLSPVGMIDLVLGTLVLWHVLVDVSFGGGILPTAAQAYGEWMLPYAAGRYAMVQSEALAKLSPWFVGAILVISIAAIFESLTSINLWSVLFHEVDDSVRRPTDKRYGVLYRAIANVRNPIFLGIFLLTLLPWTIAYAESDPSDSKRRLLGRGSLAMLILGILATVSRGPVLALIVMAAFVLSVSNRIARYVILACVLVGGLVVATNFERVVDLLDAGVNDKGAIMEIDGEAEVYDGTRHRILILKIYTPLIAKGGARGYGTVATTGFPPNIPGLPEDPRARKRLGIVDNSYLLTGLRLGYVGVGLLILLLICTGVSAMLMRETASTYLHPTTSAVMVGFSASTLAVATASFFVYCDYDYFFWIMVHCGTVAGMVSQSKLRRKGRV